MKIDLGIGKRELARFFWVELHFFYVVCRTILPLTF